MTRQVAERRKTDRVKCDTDVPAVDLIGSDTPAVLKNISRSGIACFCDAPVPEMTLVEMRIQLPALPEEEAEFYSFHCKGAVVRCETMVRGNSRKRWLIAVYFTEVEESHQQLLQRYIDTRS